MLKRTISARGVEIEGQDESYDFGSAAGFYLDATEPNWKDHYNMDSYVTKELPTIIQANFPVIEDKQSIMGHSMGGHGALTLALKNPVRIPPFFGRRSIDIDC